MLNFIVLGYIPGTTVQIDFYMFMLGVYVATICLLAVYYAHYRISRRKLQGFMPYLIKRQQRRQARLRRLALQAL